MRTLFLLAGTSLLAACGGAGPETISAAPPAVGGSGTPTPTNPTGSHSFVNPTEIKTYKGVGGLHSFRYTTENRLNKADFIAGTKTELPSVQDGQLYTGNANTVRNSAISIKFNPRDAIFDIVIADTDANVSQSIRFQDPLHRTAFGGAVQPQVGVPNLTTAGLNYLETGSGSASTFAGGGASVVPTLQDDEPSGSFDASTFFYQTPGTETKYVTFAGYLRNSVTLTRVSLPDDQITYQTNAAGTEVLDVEGNRIPISPTSYVRQVHNLQRGAFAYGEFTQNDNVRTSGTGTFEGSMIASMVFNNLVDQNATAPTFFQYLEGRATTTVDFGANTFALSLSGKSFGPQFDRNSQQLFSIQNGATFTANGSGKIDLVRTGGFLGQFNNAKFVNPNGTTYTLTLGGSSIDGAFYGPTGEEVGGGFRIVGGVPDERIDILGTFVGLGK